MHAQKILLLSDASSEHTEKWAKGIASKGIEVFVFSLTPHKYNWHKSYELIQLENLNYSTTGILSKVKYLFALKRIKNIIKEFQPTIIHAHYATSYGLLGALTFSQPFIISVWGSDVYDFPKKSFLHKSILKFNLGRAKKVLSTSHCMAKETQKYTSKIIEVTPFGIDTSLFKKAANKKENNIVIGTIKPIEYKYGTDILIKVFKKIKDTNQDKKIKFIVVGVGSIEDKIKQLSTDLELSNDILFTGRVPFDRIAEYHNMLDIYVALSVLDSESFGVATVEASACEVPVVVSDVDGFKEVVEDSKTGIIVPKKNLDAAVHAIQTLIDNPKMREAMGEKGRELVLKKYNWNDNLEQMINIYNTISKL